MTPRMYPFLSAVARRRLRRGLALGLGGLLLVAGCRRDAESTVTVGSKDFTEQLILAELMAQTIEARTDLAVRRRLNLGGTMICHAALVRGDIDVYAEYTGTALTAILNRPVVPDPERVYALVQEAYADAFDCTWLAPFGFNNTYAITVRDAFAREHGLETIGDLEPLAGEMTAGFTAEFTVREDGYPGLREAYGFAFSRTRDMDPSLMYRALNRGDVDVIAAFATDGRIVAYKLRMLADERNFFPPYQAAPVVTRALAERHPEAIEALNRLAGTIDDETMRRLNAEVDEEGRDVAETARRFLREAGVID